MNGEQLHQAVASGGESLTEEQIRELASQACPVADYAGKRVLLIVPDNTRTAPIGLMFKTLHAQLAGVTGALDVIFALGTHPPMSEEAMCRRLEITGEERKGAYRRVRLLNHAWNDPGELRLLGAIPAADIRDLSEGLFEMEVPVMINRHIFGYDVLLIVGPVFPHEVVGFSGGNKYLFPGIGGADILNFFHWLGAVVTNARIIGNKWTPVRKVVDRAGAMVPVERKCFCLVVEGSRFAGAFFGAPEPAWDRASELSRSLHILKKPKPFRSILSCAPPMYDELWVGGKCMYKLEPVLADGGELIIYAPHIGHISETHGKLIAEIGYHCRDYFLKQWDKFKNHPWGILAHSTHVYGQGSYENGVETPRARVTLATGIDEATCRKINLGYRDWRSLRPEDFMNREEEGILYVPKAGEQLYQLENPPAWARV